MLEIIIPNIMNINPINKFNNDVGYVNVLTVKIIILDNIRPNIIL